MNCPNPNCKNPVPSSARVCPACGESVGFPNVRAAEALPETSALDKRVADALISATARSCGDIFAKFGSAVNESFAIMARSLAVVENLLDNDRNIYTTYHQQLAEGARSPEENKYDTQRTAIESKLFPNYFKEIRFGCLSLGGSAPSGYGRYVLMLKTPLIERRASVFEENPFTFVNRHHITLTQDLPLGYRATWDRRALVAQAKLQSELTRQTTEADFPGMLIKDDGNTETSDFIEVHIYGPINRATVEKLIGPKPQTREDRVIWKSLERKLPKIGISVETF